MQDKAKEEPTSPALRLCSEIQLFDLCDLESCRFKSDRYCTNCELLVKFDSIKEDDDSNTLIYEEDGECADSEDDFDESDESYEEHDE